MINIKLDKKAKNVISKTADFGSDGPIVVTELPQVGEEHAIYELHTTTPSIISYWIYVNGEWINIDENLEFETQDKTVSATTIKQEITPDEGYDGLGKVTVNAVTNAIDKNIVSGNIKKDVNILGVTGTYDGEAIELQDKTVSPSTIKQEIVADENYDGLSKVTIEAIELQNKEISPSTSSQSVIPDKGYDGLREVTVNAIALQDKTVTPDAVRQEITYDSNYNGLGKVIVEAVEPVELQDKTVTPTTEIQRVTADVDYSGLGKVTINAVTNAIDKNIKAENIKNDVAILGVTGTYDGEPVELQDKTVSPTTESQNVTADEGYDGLGTVIVEAIELQNKTIAPTTESQNVTADSGYDGLGTVIVNAVTSAIDQNIIAENIKKDVEILGVTGTYEETVELQDKTVSPSTSTQKIVADENYDGLGKVTINAVTSAIDSNIKAENIKKDVSILGVTGTYEGIDEIPVPSTSLGVTYSNLRIEHPNVLNINEAVDIYYGEEKLEINDYYVFYRETLEEPEPNVAYATVSGLPQLTSEVHDFVLTIHPKMDVDTETDRLSISVNGRNVYQSQWRQEIPPEITVSVEGISQIEIDVAQLPS